MAQFCKKCGGRIVDVLSSGGGMSRECFACGKKEGEEETTEPVETWLDKMAGRAMQGMLAMPSNVVLNGKKATTAEEYALASYGFAEAMLAEKLKREKKEVE